MSNVQGPMTKEIANIQHPMSSGELQTSVSDLEHSVLGIGRWLFPSANALASDIDGQRLDTAMSMTV
jgi:hypothetical protein